MRCIGWGRVCEVYRVEQGVCEVYRVGQGVCEVYMLGRCV